jgi:hypothetical protein
MSKEPPLRTQAKHATTRRDKEVSVNGSRPLLRCDLPDAATRELQEPFLHRLHAFEEMKTAMDVMAGEIQRLRGSHIISAEEDQALGCFLDQLRLVEHKVENSSAFQEGMSPEPCDRDLELETMVCILRNDLDHIAIRACA